METMSVLAVIAVIALLAFLAESMTEYLLGELFGLIQRLFPEKPWVVKLEVIKPTLLKYTAAGVGIGLAMGVYNLDLINLMAIVIGAGETFPHNPFGELLTGLGIGRGASFIHQLVANHLPEQY